jgi:amino acid transporter
MVFTALSYLMMSRAFPLAGSVYAYAGRSIGESSRFFAGWANLLEYVVGPVFIYVAISIAIQAVLPGASREAVIGLCVAFSTIVNLMGVEATARLNRVLLCAQLAILALFLSLASYALLHGAAGAHFRSPRCFNLTISALA